MGSPLSFATSFSADALIKAREGIFSAHNAQSHLPAEQTRDRERVPGGAVYVAPGSYHLPLEIIGTLISL